MKVTCYNENGETTERIEAVLHNPTGDDRTITYFDAQGVRTGWHVRETAENGSYKWTAYDANGKVIRIVYYDTNDQEISREELTN